MTACSFYEFARFVGYSRAHLRRLIRSGVVKPPEVGPDGREQYPLGYAQRMQPLLQMRRALLAAEKGKRLHAKEPA